MSEWMDIETCPIEEPVLVVLDGIVQHAVLFRYGDESWFDASCDPWEDFHPSHWMPLPPPPETSCKQD
jgi:hypothetical protein